MSIAMYRLRVQAPAVYEAVRWTGDNCAEVFAFLGLPHPERDHNVQHDEITLPTDSLGRPGTAWLDDWILRNAATGDFESYGDEDFQSDFEPDTTTIRAFTWGESIGSAGTTIQIPVNDGGAWIGDINLNPDGARDLRDMLSDFIADVEAATRIAQAARVRTGGRDV